MIHGLLRKRKGRDSMPLLKEKFYTIEDIYKLPEGVRAELIDGRIYYMAPPGRKHQQILSALHAVIYNYIQTKGGNCEVYPAPFAVFLSRDDSNYVEPDLSIICNPNKLTDKGCTGAPDWIIEIVSPSSKRMDYLVKLFKYRSCGVREYWIVDLEKQRITVYDLQGEDVSEYSFSDSVKVHIYDDFQIDFSKWHF